MVATFLVLTLALPSNVAAQEAALRAEQSVTVGPTSTDRARMALGAGANASMYVLSPDGQTTRVLMGAGGPTGQAPETADFVLWAQDGTRIRLDMLVAEDNTPAIHMFDGDGNLTWSAP